MTERRPLSNGVLFVLGLQNLAGQLAGICAPAVTGLIVDGTGAFSAAFAVGRAGDGGVGVSSFRKWRRCRGRRC